VATSCANLTLDFCAIEFCTFTQGFYGNEGGKFNGVDAPSLISSLLANQPLVVGKLGARSLTIPAAATSLVTYRLPAGGTASALPNRGDQNLLTAVLPLDNNGIKFNNVFLGQTITLSLNARLNPGLLNVNLANNLCTQGATAGADGLMGATQAGPDRVKGTPDDFQSDDVPVPGDTQSMILSTNVLKALTSSSLGITNSSVGGLLELANRALAAQNTGGATLSEINSAVDAVNQAFHECRMVVACSDHMTETASGLIQLTIPGQVGRTYVIEASTNLQSWVPLTAVVNVNGRLEVVDPYAKKSSRRFYRAILVP